MLYFTTMGFCGQEIHIREPRQNWIKQNDKQNQVTEETKWLVRSNDREGHWLIGAIWKERASDWSEWNDRKEPITCRSQMTGKSKWLVGGDMTGKGNYLFESNDRKEQLTSRKDREDQWLVDIKDREERATCLNQVTRNSKWLWS